MRKQEPDRGQTGLAAKPATGPLVGQLRSTTLIATAFRLATLRATMLLATTLLATTLLAGCAGNGVGGSNNDNSTSSKERILAITTLKTGNFSADGRYNLSREERAQSCKRIKGKMNVRIVQLQRTGILRNSSTLARKFSGFFAGKSHGLDSRTRRQRERAILVSYNRLLVEKKCPTIDLDKELSKSPAATTKPEPPRVTTPQTR